MDEKGRMIATILLSFETSISTAFINCHSLRLLLLMLYALPKAGGNEKYGKIFERNDDAGLFK